MTFDQKNKCRYLYFMVQWFCLISWRLFDIWMSYFGIMSQYDPMFDLKIFVGHCDQYFHGSVILLYSLKTIWYMNSILWDYESVWPEVWPQNICRTLWPIFHGPVILPCILNTIQWMNIILLEYESVWPDFWPQNKCRSLWPIFHGPVILPYILKTIRYVNAIHWDYESVWPQNICRTLWPIIHGPVIFALYLEHYSVDEHHTLGVWISMTRLLTSK